MAVTASSSNWTRTTPTATSTGTIELPSNVPAGATIILGILNRTDETTTISSVADPTNGTWDVSTLRQGPTNSTSNTFRTWYYALTNSAALTGAGAPRTITVTFSGSINSQIVGGWISSDAGAMTFDALATVSEPSATTNHDSNTVATGSGSGVIIGFLGLNNGQTAAPTMDGAGETNLNGGSAFRSFAFAETFASSGSYGFETTLDTSATGIFHVASFLEPSGGSTAVPVFVHHLRQQGIA